MHLTHSTDFQRIKQSGNSFNNAFMVLLVADNNLGYSRFAVAAGRSIGNAVCRNRVKRRLRACLDEVANLVKPGWDLIIYARRPVLTSKYADIFQALKNILQSADLIG
jgi:ribonuclease P protein component